MPSGSGVPSHDARAAAPPPPPVPLAVPLTIAALIAYGSLYPFNFTLPSDSDGWALRLLSDRTLRSSFSDELGNLGLFVPFGVAAMWSFERHASRWLSAAATLIASFGLAFVLQVAQEFVPGRVAAIADVFWNVAGAAIGIGAGLVFQKVLPTRYVRFDFRGSVVLAILGLWCIEQFAPFVPGLDFGDIKNGLKPLLLYPRFEPVDLFYTFAQMLTAARLLEVAIGRTPALRAIPFLVPAIWIGRLLVGRGIAVTHVIAMPAAAALWLAWNAVRKQSPPSGVLLATLLSAFTLQELAPFVLRASPSSFSWVPFAIVLDGSMLNNLRNLAQTAFVVSGCLWLMQDIGWRAWSAVVALSGWVFVLEWTQRWIVDRSPSVTDALVTLLAGVLIGQSARASSTVKPVVEWTPSETAPASPPRLAVLLGASVAALLAVAIAMKALLQVPGVPYNMSSLLLDTGVWTLMLFAASLLWLGAGPLLLGGWMARTRYPYLVLPVGLIVLAMISRTLLKYSVTYESLDDVLGSNVLSGDLVVWLERRVRYLALYSPLAIALTLGFLATRPGYQRIVHRDRLRWLTVGLIAIVWLWLSKLIVVDWAGTDNLTELIAVRTPVDTTGVPFLFLTIALLAVNAVTLFAASRGYVSLVLAGVLTTGAIPVGWALLGIGLESNVHKYGQVFPAVQFLLGPDRQQSLSDVALSTRWAVSYVCAVAVLACGAWLGDAASRHMR